MKPDYKWIEYLKKNYPDKVIKVINFFDTRTTTEIEAYFSKTEYITFSTTFTKLDWYIKLLKCNEKLNKLIIGFSWDDEEWKTAYPLSLIHKQKLKIIRNLGER